MKRRLLSSFRLTFAALVATIAVVVAQAPAHAALPPGYTWETYTVPRGADSFDRYISIYDNAMDVYIGDGQFNADPFGVAPGDALMACDEYPDGWGIEIRMDINPGSTWHTDRIATTRGHASPYCSPWASGNIAEGTTVGLMLCMVKGTTEHCTVWFTGRA